MDKVLTSIVGLVVHCVHLEEESLNVSEIFIYVITNHWDLIISAHCKLKLPTDKHRVSSSGLFYLSG